MKERFNRITYPLSLSGVRVRRGDEKQFQIFNAKGFVVFYMSFVDHDAAKCLQDAKDIVKYINIGAANADNL